jgi:hypothetical protein
MTVGRLGTFHGLVTKVYNQDLTKLIFANPNKYLQHIMTIEDPVLLLYSFNSKVIIRQVQRLVISND